MAGDNEGYDFDMEAVSDKMGEDIFGKVPEAKEPEEGGAPAPTDALSENNTTEPSSEAVPEAPKQANLLSEDGVKTTEDQPPLDQAPPPPVDTKKAPTSWKKEEAAGFEALPPTVQAAIHRRESDFQNGIEQYKGYAKAGTDFLRVLQPHLPDIQKYGMDPIRLTGELMQAHKTMSLSDSPTRVAYFAKLVDSYKVDKTALLQALGGTAPPAAELPYVPPEVAALKEKLAQLESSTTELTAERNRQQTERTQQTLEDFTKNGHPYFWDVGMEVTQMIANARQAGQTLSLEDAYDRAVWANPATRAKVQADTAAAAKATADAAAETQRKADLEKAQKAQKATGANVRVRGRSGSATAPLGSIEDTLKETYAALNK